MVLKIKKLVPDAIIPTRNYPDDAGLDLYSRETVTLQPGEVLAVGTGIAIQLEPMTEAQIRPRSGMALNHKITVHNSPGTIDKYTGEIRVILYNANTYTYQIQKGERIAQMVIAPYLAPEIVEVDELDETERGEKGFGSSGK
jgi:dUTP pyrophosphatase